MPGVILIAGVARSGSTMLDFVLGNRSDSFSMGEIYAWYRPFRGHHRKPTCSCGSAVGRCSIWSPLGKPPARHLHAEVARSVGAEFVVDSSKNLGWIRDASVWATRDGMDVRVILPWRGVKMLAHSYWKRDVANWLENLEGYFRRLASLGIAWMPLDFDELIAAPEQALTPLYASLGASYRPGQEAFWSGEFHSLFGSGGTRSQVGQQSALTIPHFSDEFEAYWIEVVQQSQARLEAVESIAQSGRVRAESTRLPPSWYMKHRLLSVRDRLALGVDPRRDLR